jgi:hypothetical protein
MCSKKKKYLTKKIITNLKNRYYYYFYISKLLNNNDYMYEIINKKYVFGFIFLYNFEIDFSKNNIKVYLYDLYDQIIRWDKLNEINNKFISSRRINNKYTRSYVTFSYSERDIKLLNNLIDFIEKQGGLKSVV